MLESFFLSLLVSFLKTCSKICFPTLHEDTITKKYFPIGRKKTQPTNKANRMMNGAEGLLWWKELCP